MYLLFEIPIFIVWELFLEIDIFVCASGIPDSIKIMKLWASFPVIVHYHAPNKEISTNVVTEIWVWTDRHTQDQLLDYRLVISTSGE